MAPIKTKPCPFCGGTDLEQVTYGNKDREGWLTALACAECGANGPTVYIKDPKQAQEVFIKWNERSQKLTSEDS